MTSGNQSRADEYLEAVRSILPGIRARAVETEELGRIPDATVRDLEEVGVFRGLQPRQWDGLELEPATFFEGTALIASACGSTGRVAGVVGVHPWEAGLLNERAQREIWGEDTSVRISSSYAPTGHVKRTKDGFVLSGSWHFSSGVDHCDWAFLGGIPEGEDPSQMSAYLVKGSDLTVDQDSWNVAGLKGTGSKSVHLAGAFVPDYRAHRFVDVLKGNNPGFEVNDRPLYRLPWMNGIFATAIAAPAIGSAAGALDAYTEQTASRLGAFAGDRVADNTAVHNRLAAAISEIDLTRLQMRTTWQGFYALAARGENISIDAQLRCRHDAARAMSKSLAAVIDVFEIAGGGVMNLSNPIQRFLRDLLAMRNHPMGALEASATPWVQALLKTTAEGQEQSR